MGQGSQAAALVVEGIQRGGPVAALDGLGRQVQEEFPSPPDPLHGQARHLIVDARHAHHAVAIVKEGAGSHGGRWFVHGHVF